MCYTIDQRFYRKSDDRLSRPLSCSRQSDLASIPSVILTRISRHGTVKITKFQMGWGLTRTHCPCNSSQKMQECAPSKQVAAACSPIITAAVKSTCGVRRMLVSAVILIFLLAAIYWVSLNQQTISSIRRPMRFQPQPSRNPAPDVAEATER